MNSTYLYEAGDVPVTTIEGEAHMSDICEEFRVAAVQAAPVMLDRDATIDKVCALVAQAASKGANVIAFPEAFVPGYPWWIWMRDPNSGMKYYIDLYRNAVEIPGPSVQRLSKTARDNGVYFCVSVTEREGASLYLTQLWFSPKGDLMGKHRKMKATGAEMTVWGDGDGSLMPVFDTEYGRLGGLQCWEHYIPLNVAAMAAQHEQVHVSSWPIGFPDPNHPFGDAQCATAGRYYAITNACFVLMASQIWTQEQADRICDTPETQGIMQLGHGFTRIIGPNGVILDSVPSDQEGIAYADINLADTIPVSYLIDTAGHYSTPGSLQLWFDASKHKPVHIIGRKDQEPMSYAKIQDFASGIKPQPNPAEQDVVSTR